MPAHCPPSRPHFERQRALSLSSQRLSRSANSGLIEARPWQERTQ